MFLNGQEKWHLKKNQCGMMISKDFVLTCKCFFFFYIHNYLFIFYFFTLHFTFVYSQPSNQDPNNYYLFKHNVL